MRMTKIAIGVTLGLTMSACSFQGMEGAFVGDDEGRILISSDSEGMRAFGDVLNGMITNGKASADSKSAHYELREYQENEKTKRVRGFTSYAKSAQSNQK